MNILILNWRDIAHPKSGGAEIVTMQHARGWVKAGHTVTWITASYQNARSQEVIDGVRIIRRFGSYTVYFYVWYFLARLGGTFDIIVDEVHGFPFFSPFWTKTPVVVFIHEIAGEIWDFMFTFPKNYIGKWLERLYFRLYRHNIFWTDAPSTLEELVERGISRNNCRAIPCPITIPSHISLKRSRAKEKRPTFLFVSRVVRMKGIEEVIKAFSFIFQSKKDASLWIVGGGERAYIRELEKMIKEYGVEGHVSFLKTVSEKKKFELMARSHVLLHASVKEGWGLVVLEAAYCSTPAVVYNVAGLRDVVKDGATGIVIKTNSPQEMARAALGLLKNNSQYKRFQENGRTWVRSLTWQDAVEDSLSLLSFAIQSHREL